MAESGPVQVLVYVDRKKFDELNAHCLETGEDFATAMLDGFERNVKDKKAAAREAAKKEKEAAEAKAAKEAAAAEKAAATQRNAQTPPEGTKAPI